MYEGDEQPRDQWSRNSALDELVEQAVQREG
jgi:hypothetical protein